MQVLQQIKILVDRWGKVPHRLQIHIQSKLTVHTAAHWYVVIFHIGLVSYFLISGYLVWLMVAASFGADKILTAQTTTWCMSLFHQSHAADQK